MGKNNNGADTKGREKKGRQAKTRGEDEIISYRETIWETDARVRDHWRRVEEAYAQGLRINLRTILLLSSTIRFEIKPVLHTTCEIYLINIE